MLCCGKHSEPKTFDGFTLGQSHAEVLSRKTSDNSWSTVGNRWQYVYLNTKQCSSILVNHTQSNSVIGYCGTMLYCGCSMLNEITNYNTSSLSYILWECDLLLPTETSHDHASVLSHYQNSVVNVRVLLTDYKTFHTRTRFKITNIFSCAVQLQLELLFWLGCRKTCIVLSASNK